jgi:hypothetical protein
LGAEECRWSLALYPGHQSRAGNLARTNQPATVHRDRPEESLKTLARKKKAVLRDSNAELLLPMSGRYPESSDTGISLRQCGSQSACSREASFGRADAS